MGRSQWDKELDPGHLGQSTRESGMVCNTVTLSQIIIIEYNNFCKNISKGVFTVCIIKLILIRCKSPPKVYNRNYGK